MSDGPAIPNDSWNSLQARMVGAQAKAALASLPSSLPTYTPPAPPAPPPAPAPVVAPPAAPSAPAGPLDGLGSAIGGAASDAGNAIGQGFSDLGGKVNAAVTSLPKPPTVDDLLTGAGMAPLSDTERAALPPGIGTAVKPTSLPGPPKPPTIQDLLQGIVPDDQMPPTGAQSPDKLYGPARAGILAFGRSQVGLPYGLDSARNAQAPDCSLFVSEAYAQAGIKVTPFTDAAANEMAPVSQQDAKPGDTIFYKYADPSQPGVTYPHMGIYLGNGQMLDSQYGKGVGVHPMLNVPYEIKRPPALDQPQTQATAATGATSSSTPSGPTGAWADKARAAAQAAGIDPEIFARQMQQESGYDPDVIYGTRTSSAGAQGIAQFMPATAKGLGIDPLDPDQALPAAANLMASYVKQYGGDYAKALAAYNAGPGNVEKYGGVPPFEETQRYVNTILGDAARSPAGSAIGAAASAVGSGAQAAASTAGSAVQHGWEGVQSVIDALGTAKDTSQAAAAKAIPTAIQNLPDASKLVVKPTPGSPLARATGALPLSSDQVGKPLTPTEQLQAGWQTYQGAGATHQNLVAATDPFNSAPDGIPKTVLQTVWNIAAGAGSDPATWAAAPGIGAAGGAAERLTTALLSHGIDSGIVTKVVPWLAKQEAEGALWGGIQGTEQPNATPGSIATSAVTGAGTQTLLGGAGKVLGSVLAAGHRFPNEIESDIPAPPPAPGAPEPAPVLPRQTNPEIASWARDYTDQAGLPAPVGHPYVKNDVPTQTAAAQYHEQAVSDPTNPATRAAYTAMASEVHDQFTHATDQGMTFEPYHGPDPYTSSADMARDVAQNHHLWVYADSLDHPSLTDQQNWEFRAVHDLYGHAMEGYQFGPRGEENAWLSHMQMFSPEAQKAMTTETRMQNSVVNYGSNAAANKANPANTIYAEQKAYLPPPQFMQHPDVPSTRPAQVSWETSLGGSAPDNGYREAPPDQKLAHDTAVSQAIIDAQVPQKLGLQQVQQVHAPGIWHGQASAGVQTLVHVRTDPLTGDVLPEDAAKLDSLAAIIGIHANKQDAVGVTALREPATAQDANAVDLNVGRVLTPAEAIALDQGLAKASGNPDGHAIIATKQGAVVLNIGDQTQAGFQNAVHAVASGALPDAIATPVQASSHLVENDWSTNPHGESYLATIQRGGHGAIYDELRDSLTRNVSEAQTRIAQTYGWRPAGSGAASATIDGATGAGGSRTGRTLPAEPLALPAGRQPLIMPPTATRAPGGGFLHLDGTPYTPDEIAQHVQQTGLYPDRSPAPAGTVQSPAAPASDPTAILAAADPKLVAQARASVRDVTGQEPTDAQVATTVLRLGHNVSDPQSVAVSPSEIADAKQTLAALPKSDGVPVSAPPDARSPLGLALLRQRLMDLAKRGAPARKWYTDSSAAILQATGGDKAEAEKLAQLVAIYSPQTNVDENMNRALTAFSQWKAGEPIAVPAMSKLNNAASDLLYKGINWSGRKTNNFYRNLMKAIDKPTYESMGLGAGETGTTADIWMMRGFGYPGDAPTGRQYSFIESETAKVAKALGWTPDEAQAAIWSAVKADTEGTNIDTAGFHYGTALEQRAAQVNGGPLSTPSQAAALRDENGANTLAQAFGLPDMGTHEGQTLVAVPKAAQSSGGVKIPENFNRIAPVSRKLLDGYTAALGLLSQHTGTHADSVGWTRIMRNTTATPKGAESAVVLNVGRPLAPDEQVTLNTSLTQALGRSGAHDLVSTKDGAWILNSDPSQVPNPTFQKAVDSALEMVDFAGANPSHTAAAYDRSIISNDWKANPNGEKYQEVVGRSGRATNYGAVADTLRQRLQAASPTNASVQGPAGTTPRLENPTVPAQPVAPTGLDTPASGGFASRQPGSVQAGFAAHLGGAAAGAIGGYATAPSDATQQERIERAAIGAGMGLGVAHIASSVLDARSGGFDLQKLADLRDQYTSSQPPLMPGVAKANPVDQAIALTVNSMLSGVGTMTTQVVGHMGMTLARPAMELSAGHGVDAARDVMAMGGALGQAFAQAGTSLKTGAVDHGSGSAPGQGLDTRAFVPGRSIPDTLGFLLTPQSRVLAAKYEFFRVLNSAGAQAAEASKIMRQNPGMAFDDVLSAHQKQILDAGTKGAAEANFVSGGGMLAELGGQIAKWRGELLHAPTVPQKALGLTLQAILPFTKVPGVIMDMGIRGLPGVNEVTGGISAARKLAAGDAEGAQSELGKTALLAAASLAILSQVAQGNITGDGPSNVAEKLTKEAAVDADGNHVWEPNSIRLPGGRWVSHAGLGPIGINMAVIANAFEAAHDPSQSQAPLDLATTTLARTAQTITSAWYLKGLSDTLAAISSGTTGMSKVGRTVESMGDRLVPQGTLLNEIRSVTDPTVRDPQNVLQREQNRIPGLSSGAGGLLPAVPPAIEPTTGLAQQKPQDVLSVMTKGAPPRVSTPNPVAMELARLQAAGHNVGISAENASYSGATQDPAQLGLLRSTMGQAKNLYVTHMLADPKYQALPDAEKAKTLQATLRQAASVADLNLGSDVARSPQTAALQAWSQVPQYYGVSGTGKEVAQQNFAIAQAKAKLAAYQADAKAKTGNPYDGEKQFRQDDPAAYKLSQAEPKDSYTLDKLKKQLDQQFGGALLQAGNAGLVGAGSTVVTAWPS